MKHWLTSISPRQLLLVDAGGAVLSVGLLGVIIAYQPYFGIPYLVLYILATAPLGLAAFDGYCLLGPPSNYSRCLRTIAWLNVFYCGLSLGLATWHAPQITPLGWSYLGTEILVVLLLARLEWRAAQQLQDTPV